MKYRLKEKKGTLYVQQKERFFWKYIKRRVHLELDFWEYICYDQQERHLAEKYVKDMNGD